MGPREVRVRRRSPCGGAAVAARTQHAGQPAGRVEHLHRHQLLSVHDLQLPGDGG